MDGAGIKVSYLKNEALRVRSVNKRKTLQFHSNLPTLSLVFFLVYFLPRINPHCRVYWH